MKKQNKKKLVVGVVSVLAICITLIVITKMHVDLYHTYCHYKDVCGDNKYSVPEGYKVQYVERQIYSGDTVTEIAEEAVIDNNMDEFCSVQDEIKAIVELNQIHPDEITSGDYLVIPVVLPE